MRQRGRISSNEARVPNSRSNRDEERRREKESVKERTDHRACNDACSGSTDEGAAWGTTEETVPSGFSGISKKQFTDFSWRSDVEENWRTTGQSTAFHAAPRLRVQKILSPDFSLFSSTPRRHSLASRSSLEEASTSLAISLGIKWWWFEGK